MTEKINESIKFVAKHYRPDSFLPTMRFVPVSFWRRRGAVAAAVAAGILVVSACVYMLLPVAETTRQLSPEPPATTAAPSPASSEYVVKSIEFTDAPLAEVVKAIEDTYNVKISGLEEGCKVRLTLSYEGTAADLVETINELEGTKLTIEE